ncbi:hypothetical protein MHU86_3841 [Fragilaria crotonensis]|nr:hypothetical protein MHU86_3841 [Fragilaria crotonensis]
MSSSDEGIHEGNDDEPNQASINGVSSVDGDGEDDYCCVSEQVYVESGNEKKVLYLLCIGLVHRNNSNEEQPLFSFEQEPWSLLPKNSFLRPKNTDFVHEITRRANLFNITPVPRPSNWTRIQIIEWLERNPIHNVADIEFLTNEVFRLRDLLIRAQQQQGSNSITGSTAGGGGGGNWRGSVPYLRVIMCLTQDDVKRLFLARANTRSRQELDARNSQIRPPTVFEVMSDLWNSNDFNPIAPASECHVDFMNAIDCSYAHVAGLSPATPQRIEDLLVSMRSDLLRIITRWEQSGQGEGGRDAQEEEHQDSNADDASSSLTPSQQADDDDENSATSREQQNIGGLTQRPPRALQSRASFLNGRPSYLLYFWEVADAHQILQSSLQRLNNKAGAADASRAPVSSSTARSNSSSVGRSRALRRQQQQELNAGSSLIPLVESIKELAECQRQMVFDRVEDRNHERQLEEQRQQSEGAERSRERAFRRRAELVDLARKYRKLNAELKPNDESTQRLSEFYIEEGRLLEEEIRQLDSSSA